MTKKLTTDTLKNALPEPGKRLEIRDREEPGLIFRVTDKGVRSWSIRYVNAAGEHRRKSIGPFPAISLSRARDEARKIKGSVAAGQDVVGDQRAHKVAERMRRLRTIAGLAEAYFADAELGLHRANARGPKRPGTLAEEHRIFAKLIEPVFGDLPVTDLRRADIQAFVTQQSRTAPSNGRHCRAVIRQLLSYAVSKEIIDYNPAHDIAVMMPRVRDRVLSEAELRAFWRACEAPAEIEGLALSIEMSLALRMAAVTLQRGGEVVGMRWEEVDESRRLWTIPATRMKGKRAHVVPLSDLALSLLDEARHTIGGEAFVFQSPRTDTHLERRAFTRAMKRITDAIGIANATPHDLRRTGATMMTGEALGIPRFVVSQILAHAGDTGGAAAITGKHYDLNDYLGEKRRGLDAWARALTVMMGSVPPNSNVVALPNSKPSQIY